MGTETEAEAGTETGVVNGNMKGDGNGNGNGNGNRNGNGRSRVDARPVRGERRAEAGLRRPPGRLPLPAPLDGRRAPGLTRAQGASVPPAPFRHDSC